jgi:hypothetical protein
MKKPTMQWALNHQSSEKNHTWPTAVLWRHPMMMEMMKPV